MTKSSAETPLRSLLALLLAAAPVAALLPVLDNGFICLDDGAYVTGNSRLLDGFTRENLRWAFTTFHAANWHPVTWLSHLLDVRLFGLEPRGHHLASLLLHVVNAQLCFLVVRRLTGSLWRSCCAAAIFAVHPMHVESVAWVAERKDVLCGFFWLASLGAYERYVRRPGLLRYGLVLAAFSLGLMAKPMLVTLPFVLLLLDFWPLGRTLPRGGADRVPHPASRRFRVRPLLLEKLPLFALAALSCAVTYRAQAAGWMVKSAEHYPAGVRLANALSAYARYLGKIVYPVNLGIPYPHPGSAPPAWEWLGALALLLGLTGVAVSAGRRRPWLPVGWLWFLGTLVPVIGLVQVADQAMADRYVYLPLLGLLIAAAWSIPAPARDQPLRATALAAGGALLLALLGGLSHRQAGYWHDDVTLFGRTLQVTAENALARYNLGTGLARRGDVAAAIPQFREALRLRPEFSEAHYNLGRALEEAGGYDEAVAHYREALRIAPGYRYALDNLGGALLRLGRVDEAAAAFAQSVRLAPGDPDARRNLGLALWRQGNPEAAAAQCREALRIDPGYSRPNFCASFLKSRP
jgi:tetratricopeptide (TPR) repeat protein